MRVVGTILKLLSKPKQLPLHRRQKQLSALKRKTKAGALENRVRRLIGSQDHRGVWVTEGMIETREFITNIMELCDYLEMVAGGPVVTIPVDIREIPLGDAPGDEYFERW